jgi:hypothetical protein
LSARCAGAGLVAIAAAAGLAACAGRTPGFPVCVPAELQPLPEASCELDEEVADFRRDTVLTLWGYVGSRPSRFPVVVELDARARIASVCLEEGASLGWRAREQLERAARTLRAMPPGPACLAGRRLELAEDFADATRGSGRARRQPQVQELCAPGQQVCVGWRDPVCALRKDGSRKTYSDACQACRDPDVTGYDEGTCW